MPLQSSECVRQTSLMIQGFPSRFELRDARRIAGQGHSDAKQQVSDKYSLDDRVTRQYRLSSGFWIPVAITAAFNAEIEASGGACC